MLKISSEWWELDRNVKISKVQFKKISATFSAVSDVMDTWYLTNQGAGTDSVLIFNS